MAAAAKQTRDSFCYNDTVSLAARSVGDALAVGCEHLGLLIEVQAGVLEEQRLRGHVVDVLRGGHGHVSTKGRQSAAVKQRTSSSQDMLAVMCSRSRMARMSNACAASLMMSCGGAAAARQRKAQAAAERLLRRTCHSAAAPIAYDTPKLVAKASWVDGPSSL